MIIGVDEVGRGAWAGPLVVGAVALSQPITGLKDSKKLSRLSRQKLDKLIRESALFVGLGWVEPSEIDELGLSAAMKLACERALVGAPKDAKIIIDGHINYLSDLPNTGNLIKGDEKVPEISAASIVAKVARDLYMSHQHTILPGYGFDTHVGYGTKAHLEAIIVHGITSLHRKSYKPVQAYIS